MNQSLLEHLSELLEQAARAHGVLVLSDYDGTLTPIVARPEGAMLAPRVAALVRALAQIDPVAILSGRALDDVAARVGIENVIYSGNHGLEIRGPGIQFVEPSAAASAPALRVLTNALEHALAPFAGVLVENKHL